MIRPLKLCVLCAGLLIVLPVHTVLSQETTGRVLSVRTIYAQPDIDSEVVGELKVGVEVTIVSTESVFSRIKWPEDLMGYILYPKISSATTAGQAEETTPDSEPAADPTGAEPTSSTLRGQLLQPANLRNEPGLFGEVVVRLPKYAQVDILGRTRNWLLVRVRVADELHEGYVHKAMLPANLEVPPLPGTTSPVDDDIARFQ